jgi:DNA modification methylase
MSREPAKIKYYRGRRWDLYRGDCREILRDLPRNSIDVAITDPPYHLKSIVQRFSKTSLQDKNKTGRRGAGRTDNFSRLSRGFMGTKWDGTDISFEMKTWRRVYRVLKPGAYLIAFGGTRTSHRIACAIEDAGFIIRDTFMWVHGQGFPKSRNIGRDLDRIQGKRRKAIGVQRATGFNRMKQRYGVQKELDTHPIISKRARTIMAKRWQGYGTAVKPAWEPIIIAQKPMDGTIANNILKYGTGGINVDASRVSLNGDYKSKANGRPSLTGLDDNYNPAEANKRDTKGRWPANVIHDGSDEVLYTFGLYGSLRARGNNGASKGGGGMFGHTKTLNYFGAGDTGTAARFFYCAKASAIDKVFYCTICRTAHWRKQRPEHQHGRKKNNKPNFEHITAHPTVKPLELMKYLVTMFTPPRGRIIDPFAGSGTTLLAARLQGFRTIGIEQEREYIRHIRFRLDSLTTVK